MNARHRGRRFELDEEQATTRSLDDPWTAPDDFEELVGYFTAKGRTAARFEALVPKIDGRDCRTCIRKTFSFPDCCGEGWDRLRGAKPMSACRNHVVNTLATERP